MPQLAADHYLSGALAHQLAQNRYLGSLRKASTLEMTGVIDQVLEYYSRWANGDQEEKLADCRDYVANIFAAMSIPVVETAYALYALRDGLLDNLSGEIGANESREKVAKFFELLVLQLMRGH